MAATSFQSIQGKKVLVVGMGVSGLAAAAFLHRFGAGVTVTDQSASPPGANKIQQLVQQGVRAELGHHHSETFETSDLIVISPGVPETLPELEKARKHGVPVIGELELACRFINKPVIAVSGTNGKSTVTALLGHLLRTCGFRVAVGGNIGTPLVSFADRTDQYNVLVAEVSSFQLDTIDSFQPVVSVLLNITPDHLDRYVDFAAYAASKGRLFENQQSDQVAILNGHDEWIRNISHSIKAQKWFIYAGSGEDGANFQNNQLTYQTPQHQDQIDLSVLKLPGLHNRENAAAAVLAAIAFGAAPPDIAKGLATFQGLSHRIEWVAEIGGVSFYNDSKATNIDAVARALETFDQPIVLIMGGRHKGYAFSELADRIKGRVRMLIALGETAADILAQLGNVVDSKQVATMEDAVGEAYSTAHAGDVVLLSPGCASFDMFTSYAHRGDVFCSAVKALEQK